jgi:hypothetical protein
MSKKHPMKNLHYLLFFVLLVTSCASPKKYLVNQNYDAAIEKAVHKLLKSPRKGELMVTIDRAYKLANQQDLERVKFLEQEGSPRNYDEAVNIYRRLKNRQALVNTVTPFRYNGKVYDYQLVDYDQKLIQSKRKAADYLYAHGNKLMQNGDKESIRKAYEEFTKVKAYTGDYTDIDQKIAEARDRGMSRVLVQAINNTHLKFSPQFMDNLLTIDNSGLNSFWVEYDFRDMDRQMQYDYYVNVDLNNIMISPDKSEEKDYTEQKKVEDGWNYALDSRGNVMKDSLGNDIKIKKYKELKCTVIETHQHKSCQVNGVVEYLQNNPSKLLRKVPIGANLDFDHSWARAVGDLGALSEESKKKCQVKAMPFPSNLDMVYEGTDKLKLAITNVIRNNRSYIY